jgi:hypothetical protein
MKKRIISIMCVILFAIAVILFVEGQFLDKSEQQVSELGNSDNVISENSDHSAEKQSKQLDEKYFVDMNEETSLKTTNKDDNEEYSIKVTDAVMTKDVGEYSSKFESPYYYTDKFKQYVNDEGVYGEGAYYIVVTVEISNYNDGVRDILVPGGFMMEYFNSNAVEGNNLNREYDEFVRGVVIDGSKISSKGHVQLKKGEHCTAVLIYSITDEKLEQMKQEDKSMYLTLGENYIQYIPNDDNRVRFIKMNFKLEG